MYFAHPIDFFFFALPIWKKIEFIRYGFFLFLVLIFIRPILEQSINNKMVNKI